MFENLLGQEHARKVLCSMVDNNRLPYGLLLYGPPSVGKFTAAVSFTKGLNCKEAGSVNRSKSFYDSCECPSCKKVDARAHPDVYFVEPDKDSENITIDSIRTLVESFELKRNEGLRKVCLIREADKMNSFAANALLKLLEEPKGGATIILTSSNASALLDTIKSRCQTVRFSFLSDSDLQTLCAVNETEASDVEIQVMGGVYRPAMLVDSLCVLKYLWDGSQPELDPKMTSEVLAKELVYLGCVFNYMLKAKLYEFQSITVLRANADKLTTLIQLAEKCLDFLDRGVRALLVMKYFEQRARGIIS